MPAEAPAKDKMTAKDVTIVRSRETKQITLPGDPPMPIKEAITWLQRKDAEEDKEVAILHTFDCFPLDGAVALRDALGEIYGFVAGEDIPGGFFQPDQPPLMVGVPISATEVRQVPWGRVAIPGITGYLQTSMEASPNPKFVLIGKVRQRHLPDIAVVVAKITERLKDHSIYRGKAFVLDLEWMRNGQGFHPVANAPKFDIPTDSINEKDLVFPTDVGRDVELGLFTPIEYSEACKKNGVPSHRGVLLAGPPGVGKTLTAYVTAKKAVNNGFTFIYLKSVLDLAQGMRIAAQYAPAVLFAEDVDRVVSGERNDDMDAILNAFDGVDTKDKSIMTVLTTNFLEKLNQALLRPGRCDTLVQVTAPDAEASARLVLLYGRGLINESADMKKIGVSLNGRIPAEIREAVERAKLAAICRLKGADIAGQVMELDVLDAVHAMEAHHKLLAPKDLDNRTLPEKCFDIFGKNVAEGMAEVGVQFMQKIGIPGEKVRIAAGDPDMNEEGEGTLNWDEDFEEAKA